MRSIRTLGEKVRPIPTWTTRRDDAQISGVGAVPMIMIGRQSLIWSHARAASIASPRGCPVCDHADKRTCHELIDENIPVGSTVLYTDEYGSYPGCHPNSWDGLSRRE
jgi:hypothetical protein